MAGYKENKAFMEFMFTDLLDDSIEWIQNNMEPEDVFSVEELSEWAKESGFVEEATNAE